MDHSHSERIQVADQAPQAQEIAPAIPAKKTRKRGQTTRTKSPLLALSKSAIVKLLAGLDESEYQKVVTKLNDAIADAANYRLEQREKERLEFSLVEQAFAQLSEDGVSRESILKYMAKNT